MKCSGSNTCLKSFTKIDLSILGQLIIEWCPTGCATSSYDLNACIYLA